MKIKQYQVDAFASRAFEGNPAAVCPLDTWLDDDVLQALAEENNLSETAFFVPSGRSFHLRWFTPAKEVDLCGHATLAAAHVIFEKLGYAEHVIAFETRSGQLLVEKSGSHLQMDFPARPAAPCSIPELLVQGSACSRSRYWPPTIIWRCWRTRLPFEISNPTSHALPSSICAA